MTPPPYKFGSANANDGEPYVYGNIWEQETTTGSDRLVIAPAEEQIALIQSLSKLLPEPFGVLYVLLVPRGNHKPGRYQVAEPVSRESLEAFLNRFKEFFEQDARHEIWVASLPSDSTLVYDSHNVIYAYGPLDIYKDLLKGQGMNEASVRFPKPHIHHYNIEFDEEEREVLAYWEWKYFPLTEQDG